MRSAGRHPFLVLMSVAVAFVMLVACSDEGSPAGVSEDEDVPAPEGQPVARGAELFNTEYDCIQCHSISGEEMTGPPLDGIVGEEVTFEDGTTTVRDDAYLREAILEPDAHIVEGYPSGVMEASVSGRRDEIEDDVDALIAFIRSLE